MLGQVEKACFSEMRNISVPDTFSKKISNVTIMLILKLMCYLKPGVEFEQTFHR